MIMKNLKIHCDNCHHEKRTSIINAFKSYKKACPHCGHILARENDVVMLAFLVLFSFILSPVNWLYGRITGKKNVTIRVYSDDGENYKMRAIDKNSRDSTESVLADLIENLEKDEMEQRFKNGGY